MSATTNVQVTKMELIPQRVSWNGVDLGGTLDNVAIEPNYSKGEIKADQYGTTILDRRINGIAITVKTKLTQVKDVETWSKAFPTASYADVGGDKAIEFRLNMGQSDYVGAAPLVLHPLDKDDGDVSEDHTFYLAYPAEVSPITYGPEEQSGLEVTWNVYRATGNGGRWYRFGDPDVVIPV